MRGALQATDAMRFPWYIEDRNILGYLTEMTQNSLNYTYYLNNSLLKTFRHG